MSYRNSLSPLLDIDDTPFDLFLYVWNPNGFQPILGDDIHFSTSETLEKLYELEKLIKCESFKIELHVEIYMKLYPRYSKYF